MAHGDEHATRHLAGLLRRHGLALTVQRRAVFDAILARRDHPTADDVCAEVRRRFPGVARTTVYRVLETLVAIGAITKASTPGAAVRYDPLLRRHHHLVCDRCDALFDLDDRAVGQEVRLPRASAGSFEVHDYSIHFRGLCAACRRKSGRANPKDGADGASAGRARGRRVVGQRVSKTRAEQKVRNGR